MYFKYEFTIRDLALTPTGVHYPREYPLVFDYEDVKVAIRPPTPEEEASGHKGLVCLGEAVGEFDAPRRVSPMFERLARGDLPEASTPNRSAPYWDPERDRLRENHLPPLGIMPPAFRDFASRVETNLRDHAHRTARVLRWQRNVEGPHNPFSYRGFRWSLDANDWHSMPSTITASVRSRGSLRVDDAEVEAVRQTVAESGDEPLSHQLFREASLQQTTNLRSAVVVGVAAVEVATKECIAALDPQAEWLVREAPTPPVERMLREYVPTLPARNHVQGKVEFPSELLDDLKKAVGWRNQVAHGGVLPVGHDRVERFLDETAHDLIWLLTYYSKAHWALDHVGKTTRARLGISSRWLVSGIVDRWNEQEQWGVLTSPEIPGEVWADASMLAQEGRTTLTPGDSVVIEAEGPLSDEHEGFRYRGITIHPR